jgi:membrane fusion protein (multidrug efflux system)
VVADGLKVGDRVVVQGTDKARPGQQVKPVPAQLPGTPASDATANGAQTGQPAAQPASAASGA